MIRLIGVLTHGGVPIKVKSSMDAEGDLILGPLIEVLIYAWKKLDSEKYLKLARETFDTAHTAWIKYNFH